VRFAGSHSSAPPAEDPPQSETIPTTNVHAEEPNAIMDEAIELIPEHASKRVDGVACTWPTGAHLLHTAARDVQPVELVNAFGTSVHRAPPGGARRLFKWLPKQALMIHAVGTSLVADRIDQVDKQLLVVNEGVIETLAASSRFIAYASWGCAEPRGECLVSVYRLVVQPLRLDVQLICQLPHADAVTRIELIDDEDCEADSETLLATVTATEVTFWTFSGNMHRRIASSASPGSVADALSLTAAQVGGREGFLVTAGSDGVIWWSARGRGDQTDRLHSRSGPLPYGLPESCAFSALCLAAGRRAVFAGTQTGDVVAWTLDGRACLQWWRPFGIESPHVSSLCPGGHAESMLIAVESGSVFCVSVPRLETCRGSPGVRFAGAESGECTAAGDDADNETASPPRPQGVAKGSRMALMEAARIDARAMGGDAVLQMESPGTEAAVVLMVCSNGTILAVSVPSMRAARLYGAIETGFVRLFATHRPPSLGTAVAPVLGTVSLDGRTVRVQDTLAAVPAVEWELASDEAVGAIAFCGTGASDWVLGTTSGVLRRLRMSSRDRLDTVWEHSAHGRHAIRCVCIHGVNSSTTTAVALSGDEMGVVWMTEMRYGRPLREFRGASAAAATSVDAGEHAWVVASRDRRVVVWTADWRHAEKSQPLHLLTDAGLQVVSTSKGAKDLKSACIARLCGAGDSAGVLVAWDAISPQLCMFSLTDGVCRWRMELPAVPRSLAVSSGGAGIFAAVGLDMRTMRLVDVMRQCSLGDVAPWSGSVRDCVFVSNAAGELMVAGSDGAAVFAWKVVAS
jgi:hypothetical protein